MFDAPASATAPPVLDARAIDALRAELSDALAAPTGLGDHDLVESVRALEELACVVTAAQAHLSAELDAQRRGQRAARGLPVVQQGRAVAHEIARARRESPHRGQRHLALATVVPRELPATWRAWREGRITEFHAVLVARETACLTRDDRLEVDARVAGDAERLEHLGLRQLEAQLRAEAGRLDPAAVVRRRRQAEADRHVTLRPAPDTMTWLTALLPVKDGVAAFAALTRAADSARATGDPRTKGQVMADALVGRLLEGATDDPATPPVSLHVVMSDTDLFGSEDEPARLEGFGPIPAELAREIVSGALTEGERVWLRRLYAHPTTGELVAMDRQGRLFRGSLGRFIRLRDQVCRTPWCDAPVRHLDHALGHAADGPTSGPNAQGLCELCSYAKEAPGWRAGPSPGVGHTIETRLPTGHTYRSRPPALVATIRAAPTRIDDVLTG
jgi:hypothetical protein